MFKINKKGELTTQQLVMLIVLIVSFAVILLLLFRLNLGETSDKEICRNSIILKGQTNGFSGSIDCRTNRVCISGGEDCVGGGSKVPVKADNKTQIMKAIASEMSDCWYMFGEGKVGYGEGLSASNNYAICSIIEFDLQIQEKTTIIQYQELYDYLKTTRKEGSQSYLNYLYGVNSLESLGDGLKFSKVDVSQEVIVTSARYSVVTGIDNNLGVPGVNTDKIFKVSIIPTAETSVRLTGGEFITKA